jgi:hypothetical protein
MEAAIPFAGFYDSVWSSAIDNAFDQQVEYSAEDNALDAGDVRTVIDRNFTWAVAAHAISRAYVSAYQCWLEDEHEVKVELAYAATESPKEYNFATDRIFVTLIFDDVQTLHDKCEPGAIRAAAKDLFTSRPGFISFYNPDIISWGDLRNWDHNHLLAIFVALGEPEALYAYGNMSEEIDKAVSDAIDWRRVEKDFEILAEGEEPDNGKHYPRGDQPMPRYVAEYLKANRLKGDAS